MLQATLKPKALDHLRALLSGTVINNDNEEYENSRKVWNGIIDRHPDLIVRCLNATDVATAITFAREQDMEVAVRSGGHSMAGHSTIDGGVVIDLSLMKEIKIDRMRRIARIEPGLTWGEVAMATHPYSLALTSGDMASVGVGGLMLGGGIGWMVRKHGLTIDRLRAVELVTAEGEILRASERAYPELFWGLRGGGGNFGVATAFEVDLHPAGTVLGGAIFYDADEVSEVEGILQSYVHYATSAPNELSTHAMLMTAPPASFIPQVLHGRPVVTILVCYTGDLEHGESVVAPFRQLATPIADLVKLMPYPDMFSLTKIGTIRGLEQHVRSLFLHTLSNKVLHTLVVETLSNMTSETIVQVRVLGGAMGQLSADATAFAHRTVQAMVIITNFGPGSIDGKARSARTEKVWQALQPYAHGVYVNFLAEEGEKRIHEAYPPDTYKRLVVLKDRFDPTNFFHMNQNIKPSGLRQDQV